MADVVEEKGSADIHESPQTKAGSDPVDERGLHRHSKKELEQLEELVRTELSVVELSDAEKKRVLRKIDWILVPQLALLYLLGFLDRGNIGNAKIAGMEDDLQLYGLKYNVVVMVFFITYGGLEVPCNIILKMLRPSIWIPGIMVAWGIVMTLMCRVESYGGLIAARLCLGIAEAGFFPGATFLLTLWYRRYEVQARMAFFYAAATLSGAFSGLLAFALEKMDGIGGMAGWRWIFCIEGLVTIAVGCCTFFTLPDSPATAKFLNEHEKQYLISRLQIETGSGHGRVTNDDKIHKRYIIGALKEWKIWLAVICWWGNSVTVYGLTYTLPTVLLQLGYKSTIAQLMTIPIYVFALLGVVGVALISDKYQSRSPVVITFFWIGSLGFLALLCVPHPRLPGLTYAFLFPAALGIYAPVIPLLGWFANNLAPSSRRAVGMALLISVGNLGGGLIGSNIFLSTTAPHYYLGYGVCCAVTFAAGATAWFLRSRYQDINRKRDLSRDGADDDEHAVRARYTEGELLDMGDHSPFFRYTL